MDSSLNVSCVGKNILMLVLEKCSKFFFICHWLWFFSLWFAEVSCYCFLIGRVFVKLVWKVFGGLWICWIFCCGLEDVIIWFLQYSEYDSLVVLVLHKWFMLIWVWHIQLCCGSLFLIGLSYLDHVSDMDMLWMTSWDLVMSLTLVCGNPHGVFCIRRYLFGQLFDKL